MTFSLAKLGRSHLFTNTVPFSLFGERFSSVFDSCFRLLWYDRYQFLTSHSYYKSVLPPVSVLLRLELNFTIYSVLVNHVRKNHKTLHDISSGIDDDIFNLPFDLCEKASEENCFSLITRPVNPRRQNLHALMSAFPRLGI